MFKWNKNREKKKIKPLSLIFYIVLFISLIKLIVLQFDIYDYDKQIKEYKSNIQNQKEVLEEYKNNNTVDDLDDIMEELARNLGYVKPSEKLFVDINK